MVFLMSLVNGNRRINVMLLAHTGVNVAEYGVNNSSISKEHKSLIPSAVFGTDSIHSEFCEERTQILSSCFNLVNSTRLIIGYEGLQDLIKDNPISLGDEVKLYSFIQVEGPELNDSEKARLNRLGELLIREAAKRYMTKEIIQGMPAETITCIEILNESLNKFKSETKEKIFSGSNQLERVIERELNFIMSNETEILEEILKKIPLIGLKTPSGLKDAFTQSDYEEMIFNCREFVKSELSFFEKVLNDINYANSIKLTGDNSFLSIIKDYDLFTERNNLIESKKELLKKDLVNIINKLEEFGLREIINLLPTTESLDEFIQKVKSEITSSGSASLNAIREQSKFIKNKGEPLKLKQLINKSIQLIDDIAKYDGESELHSIKGQFYDLCQGQLSTTRKAEDFLFNKLDEALELSDNKAGGLTGAQKIEKELVNKIILKKIIDYDDFRIGYRSRVISLNKNLWNLIISALYERVFNDYNNFQQVLSYNGDVKELFYKKARSLIEDFVERVQNFSFPAILNNLLGKVKVNDTNKKLSINLLQNYLKNFLYDHFKDEQFIKRHDDTGNEKTPIIAFDSYSLRFCSEIIKKVKLSSDLYSLLDQSNLPKFYKEQFVQLLDNSDLTKIGVATELDESKDLFNSWRSILEERISELGVTIEKTGSRKIKNVVTIDSVLDKAESLFDYDINIKKNLKKLAKEEEKKLERKRIIDSKVFFNKMADRDRVIEIYSNRNKILSTIGSLSKLLLELDEIKTTNDRITEDNKKFKEANKKELLIEPFDKEEVSGLINDFKLFLAESYKDDIKVINKVADDISKLLKAKDIKLVNKLFTELSILLKSADKIISNKDELSSILSALKSIPEQGRLEETLNDLEKLDNEFLKLPNYTHIKGLIKTVINPGAIIKEAKVEDKNRSEDLLMQALVNTYAELQEEYYGHFKTIKVFRHKSILSKLRSPEEVQVIPGRYLREQYNIVSDSLRLINGVNLLKNFFEAANESKHGLINLGFLMNYLPEHFKRADNMINILNDPKNLDEFASFLINNFNPSKLSNQLNDYWINVKDYIEGRRNTKPQKPFDLCLINSDVVQALDERLDHTISVSERKVELLKAKINEIDKDQYAKMVNKIFSIIKSFNFESVDYSDILRLIERGISRTINNVLTKWGLNEIELSNINKIRIRSSLDPLRYVIPEEIEARLPVENRHSVYYQRLINASIDISNELRKNMSNALYNNEFLKDLLTTNIECRGDNFYFTLPKSGNKLKKTDFEMPELISRLLGSEILIDGGKILLRIPFKPVNQETQTFGSALIDYVSSKLADELKPCKGFLQEYSNKVHTGFEKVAE